MLRKDAVQRPTLPKRRAPPSDPKRQADELPYSYNPRAADPAKCSLTFSGGWMTQSQLQNTHRRKAWMGDSKSPTRLGSRIRPAPTPNALKQMAGVARCGRTLSSRRLRDV